MSVSGNKYGRRLKGERVKEKKEIYKKIILPLTIEKLFSIIIHALLRTT